MADIQPNWQQIYQWGKGSAPIWQGNPGLDDLKQRYNAMLQNQAANTKDFTAELAKLNFNGARDADMPELHNDYGKILNTFQQYRTSNDPKQQQALNLQMRQLQNQFLYKAQVSKQENDEYHEDAKLAHNPNVNLDDSFFGDMKQRAKVSSFDPKYQDFKNKSYILPEGDPTKIWDNAFERSKSESKESGAPVKDKATGEYKTPQYNTTSMKQDDFTKNVISELKGSPKQMHIIAKQYPDLPIDQAVQKFAQDGWNAKQNKLGTDTTFSAPYESYGQKVALADRRANAAAIPPVNAAPQEVKVKIKGDDGTVTGVMNLHNYKAVPIKDATVIPTRGINNNGQEVDVPAGSVRVIGYADMPVSNRKTDVLKKGQMVMSHFEENNPDMVGSKPVVHIQVTHKGHIKDFYVDPNTVDVNNTGQKAQSKAVNKAKNTTSDDDPQGLFKK